jgi:hypothetical protein
MAESAQASNIGARMIVNEAGGQPLIDYPWKEQATLVRVFDGGKSGGQTNEILFEGPLLALAEKVRAMPAVERRGLRMSLPDRHVRPYTFQDAALSALIENIPSLKS